MTGWFSRWLDHMGEAIRANNRRWIVRGQACGHETTIARAGWGIRTGPALKLAHCPVCGALGMIEIYRKPGET